MSSFFDRLFGSSNEKASAKDPAPVEYKNEGATEDGNKKVSMRVTGRVQGVGFRYSTKQVADQIPVSGIVRNENDGSVYIEAVGNEETIQRFIDAVRRSPSPSAHIDSIVVEEDPTIEDYTNFSVSN